MPITRLLGLLHILTLNVWALPDLGFHVVCPFRGERIAQICVELKAQSAKPDSWDVVLLQEAWLSEDREALKHCGYPYSVDLDNHAKVIDSGTMILSRYPLEEAARLTYSALSGNTQLNLDGEAMARKSAIIARVMRPDTGPYWVSTTHLISTYDEKNDKYAEARKTQFTSWIDWAQKKAGTEPLVLGGDLNFGPGMPLWDEIPQLLSTFKQSAGADQACTLCPPNVMHVSNEGKVDHIFGSAQLKPVSGGIRFDQPTVLATPGLKLPVSDHFGWETVFQLESK